MKIKYNFSEIIYHVHGNWKWFAEINDSNPLIHQARKSIISWHCEWQVLRGCFNFIGDISVSYRENFGTNNPARDFSCLSSFMYRKTDKLQTFKLSICNKEDKNKTAMSCETIKSVEFRLTMTYKYWCPI